MNFNLDDGFTLIELLVSMMILSMVMMLVYGTLNFSASALGRSISHTDIQEGLSQSQSLIRTMIERSIPERGSFSGTAGGFEFLSTINKNGGSEHRYILELSESDETLLLNWKAEKDPLDAGSLVLAQDVSTLKFEYAADDIYETGLWQSNWQSDEQPSYVRIALKSETFWPEMIIELKQTHTIECWYDPVSQGCRYR